MSSLTLKEAGSETDDLCDYSFCRRRVASLYIGVLRLLFCYSSVFLSRVRSFIALPRVAQPRQGLETGRSTRSLSVLGGVWMEVSRLLTASLGERQRLSDSGEGKEGIDHSIPQEVRERESSFH